MTVIHMIDEIAVIDCEWQVDRKLIPTSHSFSDFFSDAFIDSFAFLRFRRSFARFCRSADSLKAFVNPENILFSPWNIQIEIEISTKTQRMTEQVFSDSISFDWRDSSEKSKNRQKFPIVSQENILPLSIRISKNFVSGIQGSGSVCVCVCVLSAGRIRFTSFAVS